ncbi:PREDICTED: telomere-associated RIF1 [Prunus dulcis]|uniref:PREDICTED: telomere-associated RIF1 n=1 Tax=Prunus dulcis TaxID=3755 RepID=A0A5E4E7V1_PRUDU|nr:uncharacterized protein LOC117635959 isoform X2 [Prunus dulcis]VVA10801.1 PREDICTED: telomere-associated RIF1 [Prunus dulcis]
MSNFSDQLDEIKYLISSASGTKANKSFAYSTLLHLQQQSSDSHASIQKLARTSQSLIHPIVADIQDDDEEIATQALKCLGFMIYHPSIVAEIAVDDVKLVLESLAKLITTTKMKAVCNLGVWCVSVQQLAAPLLAAHFNSLLLAVVHAIDNPIGSLSTTFEAMQAVMKLASLLSESMRELSHVWASPIYRRLLSFDKRERDMSERCLLKIKSTILPPPLNLSKALVKDLKPKLLTGMHNMLNNGMKVHTIQAWGWFVRLLGPHALKNRHLINEMLKIPQHTFSDHDAQVQIASQVAWEGLIDALVHPPMVLPCETSDAKADNGVQQIGTYKGNCGEIQENGSLKSIKLIMTPLIGIMSTNCDVSVQLACLNTWCYLLHKLDTSVNDSSMIRLVVQPIFEAVFQMDPDGKNFWTRNLCVDLLNDFILAKCKDIDYDSLNQVSHQLSAKSYANAPPISGNCSWKQYPIKWLPWDLSLLDFHLKVIYVLICQLPRETVSHDNRIPAADASLKLFRSVLKGIQLEFKRSSISYNDIMLCLNAILKFIKNVCEEVNSNSSDRNDLHHICLQLVEAVGEEIEPTIVGSPLYKVPLDIKHIEYLQADADIGFAKLDVSSVAYMDMVSPMVYLSVLYFCVVVQSTLRVLKTDFILHRMQKYFKFMLSSFDPLESLVVTSGLLYKHSGPSCLSMWIAIAEGLKFYINDVKDFSLLKMDSDSKCCFAMLYLLSYPLVVCSCTQKDFKSANIRSSPEESPASLQIQVELERVITLWTSLYGSMCTSLSGCFTIGSFFEDLFSILDRCLDKYTSMLVCGNELELKFKGLDLHLIALYGDVLICILENFHSSEISSDGNDEHGSNYQVSSAITCCLKVTIRYMELLQTKIGTDSTIGLSVASRVYSTLAYFISSLHLKEDILSFFELISSPLLQWLVLMEMQNESTSDQFQLLWAETLGCLRRSQPPIIFDSAFLKLQAPILEKTLDHPNLSISEETITFWNSTYGEQTKLDYPKTLLNVLDKLWRNGRINLHKRSLPLQRCQSRPQVAAVPPRYRVNATHNRVSKRVELVEDTIGGGEHKEMPHPSLKRRRLELTEHQKEVRRAQQGRERDCGGHGPGVQTFTSVDFSQGNNIEDSQENPDIRNAECILELLRNG